MVFLSKLNKICSNRFVARGIPAQIACRILGNESKPCQLDPLCVTCEKVGLWLFYGTFTLILSACFFVIFWILRITRISKLLNLVTRLVTPPIKWASYVCAGIYNFYKNLPF